MAIKQKKKTPLNRLICDPAICWHCEYIGEGDFICDKYSDDAGNPAILVLSDWEPTDDFLKCIGGIEK